MNDRGAICQTLPFPEPPYVCEAIDDGYETLAAALKAYDDEGFGQTLKGFYVRPFPPPRSHLLRDLSYLPRLFPALPEFS